jgi:long-chain fatty acid transport protein
MEKTIYFGCFKVLKEIHLLTKIKKMKRKLLLAITAAFLSTSLMAGGIMTNTNQSAAYVRMLARNASLGIDAVYYNPAGLMKLNNGFHFSLNNQTIFQTKDVVNNYPYLNDNPNAKYTGIVKAPVFPGVYLAYKMDKLAFSFGFNPVGGGGGATYDKGLPSFEMGISDIVPSLMSKGIPTTKYSADINFEGTSVYFGYQFGISYEINPSVSVFAGIRTVTAKNTYKGGIKNIMINPTYPAFGAAYTGGMVLANTFFTSGATTLNNLSAGATQYVAGLQPIVTGGGGTVLLSNGTAVGLSAAQVAQIQQILGAAGLTPAQIGAQTIASAQGVLTAAAPVFTTKANSMSSNAASTKDVEVDAVQKGSGYTPILGANLTLAEKLTIAIKYEFLTKIELTNETKVDGSGLFTDGDKTRNDMPAMLSIGASYPLTDKFKASLSYNYYFDKTANYGKKNAAREFVANKDVIDKNYFELSAGLEYNITDKFLVSAGYLLAKTGVSEAYQSDLSYSLTSNTVGFGGQYNITKGIAVNLAALNTFYSDGQKHYDHMLGTTAIHVTEDYAKTTWMVAVGLDVSIGK